MRERVKIKQKIIGDTALHCSEDSLIEYVTHDAALTFFAPAKRCMCCRYAAHTLVCSRNTLHLPFFGPCGARSRIEYVTHDAALTLFCSRNTRDAALTLVCSRNTLHLPFVGPCDARS